MMDIPAHILEAVHTSSDDSPPKRVKSTSSSLRHPPNAALSPNHYHEQTTSQEPFIPDDQSSISDPDPEDYATDYTTPDASEMPDDVEEFRDREYPQLKGKTYLDHGGTTVRIMCLVVRRAMC